MNATKSTIVKVSLALTSLALCVALAMFATFATSCASSDNGGSGGGGNPPPAGTSGGGSTGTPTGGTPAASGNSVTFNSGQAQGQMTGYGWIALGSADSASDPTCSGVAITSTAPCNTATTWSSTSALCITGAIPALSAAPLQAEYDANWGLQIGVNSNETDGVAIAKTYSAIAIAVSGSPTSGLRVEIHRKGDAPATTYCAANTGSAIPLTNFNTHCWDNGGTAFAAADAALIDKVGIQVSSTQSPITVTNLCLNSITFN